MMSIPHICDDTLTGPSKHGLVHGQIMNIRLGAEGKMSPNPHTLIMAAPIPMCACMCPWLSQCKITPLHPHISAANHCLHWMTPYGLKHLNSLSGHLPAKLIARERVMLVKAVKPKPSAIMVLVSCDSLNFAIHLTYQRICICPLQSGYSQSSSLHKEWAWWGV